MICVVIKGPSLEKAKKQIDEALPIANLLEFRIDYFDERDLKTVSELLDYAPLPVIFTLRSERQGGAYPLSEKERIEECEKLAVLKPAYFDVETNTVVNIPEEVKLIVSYHDYEKTPVDFDIVYEEMLKIPAAIYKLAFFANSTIDTLRLLVWAKNKEGIIPISMGPLGIPGRILAPVLGVPFVFAPLNEGETSAPGQIPVKELIKTYHFNKLNRETAVYGLLGFPVAQSPSHVTHNAIFEHFEINAVYVKLLTPPESLEKVLSLIKQLPFKGVNLTIPLKEAVIPFLDENHSTCNSVNTLDIRDRVKGYSTDGAGALNPIEEHIKVKGKKIVVLGAGGAAKAIVEEAKKRGALVVVMNRSYNEDLETQPLDPTVLYDILINTTPIEIPLAFLKKGKFVLDIKHDTKCSIQAESEGCKVIPGYKMFVEQAAAQFKIWLNIDCKDILDRLVFNYSNK